MTFLFIQSFWLKSPCQKEFFKKTNNSFYARSYKSLQWTTMILVSFLIDKRYMFTKSECELGTIKCFTNKYFILNIEKDLGKVYFFNQFSYWGTSPIFDAFDFVTSALRLI